MPTTPWRAHGSVDPDREYRALVSFIKLKQYRTIPRFFRYSGEIQNQLSQTSGVIGYSLRAQLVRRQFWTLSVWDDEQALTAFVGTSPHARVIQDLRGRFGQTAFVRWSVKGAAVPLNWEDAVVRIEQDRKG